MEEGRRAHVRLEVGIRAVDFQASGFKLLLLVLIQIKFFLITILFFLSLFQSFKLEPHPLPPSLVLPIFSF